MQRQGYINGGGLTRPGKTTVTGEVAACGNSALTALWSIRGGHDAPDVATGVPDVADGDETAGDDELLPEVLAVPGVAVWAAAGRATAIATAPPALTSPAAAVAAASLALPRLLACLARSRSRRAGSCSLVMVVLRFIDGRFLRNQPRHRG